MDNLLATVVTRDRLTVKLYRVIQGGYSVTVEGPNETILGGCYARVYEGKAEAVVIQAFNDGDAEDWAETLCPVEHPER